MNNYDEIKRRLSGAESVCVITGSGISADSGVPTFRGKDGLWRNFRAEELATPEAFSRNPKLVWEWYNWRRGIIASKKPNAAHYALSEMEGRYRSFTLITQNVDGLHVKAGSRKVIEIHGNIWKVRCISCGAVSVNNAVPMEILPHCDKCEGLLRPHIVWFGESLNESDLRQSMEALQQCDVLLIVGTSGIVQPVASFASVARTIGAYIVEINIEETPNSYMADETVIGRASETVPRLV